MVDRRVVRGLFAFLFGIYLLTASGHTYAVDEEYMVSTTANILAHGSFAVDVGTPDTQASYSGYGPIQSIGAVPFYLAGKAMALLFPARGATWIVRAILSWYNPLVTAGTGVLLYLAVIRLRYRPKVAVGVALLYGLATTAWPHSKSFFSEPLTAFALFGSFVCALWALPSTPQVSSNADPGSAATSPQHSKTRLLVVSGLLAGLAPLVKIQAGLALPLLGLFVAGLLFRQPASRSMRSVYALIAWGGSACIALAVLAIYQQHAFGSPFTTGYGTPERLFRNDLFNGLYSLLISPGKGIVWYAPPLLLLPIALWWFWRRSASVAALCAAMIAANLVFYARLNFWHGDGTWGPRYLNIALPFFMLPLAAYLDRMAATSSRLLKAAYWLTLLLTIPVQIGGLTINIDTYLNMQTDEDRRYYNPPDSPIVQHLVFAARQLRQLSRTHFASKSIVLADGFSYSEGNRDMGEQLPRWSLPHATFDIRAGTSSSIDLNIKLNGCREGAPAQATLQAATMIIFQTDACPPRSYHVFLPPNMNRLTLDATPWDPQAAKIEREGPLGVFIQDISGEQNGHRLSIQGDLIPIPPIPSGQVSLRHWAGDHRLGHWDFWWWYLAHGDFPLGPSLLLSALWLAVALSCITWGYLRLRRVVYARQGILA